MDGSIRTYRRLVVALIVTLDGGRTLVARASEAPSTPPVSSSVTQNATTNGTTASAGGGAAPKDPNQDSGTALAREHFNRAQALYDKGYPEAALLELRRAYEVKPHYRLLFNIGELAFTTHDYVGSLRSFERFLSEGGQEIEPAKRAEAESRIGTLRALVGQLQIRTTVEGASVSIDDEPIGITPLSAPSMVNAGRHRVTATREGFLPANRIVSVLGGERTDAELELAPIVAPGVLKPDRELPSRFTTLSWIGIAASASLAAGAVTMFVVSENANAELANYEYVGATPPQGFYDDQSAVQRDRIIAIGLAGAAVATLGTTLFFTLRSPSDPKSVNRTDIRARATLGGIEFTGQF